MLNNRNQYCYYCYSSFHVKKWGSERWNYLPNNTWQTSDRVRNQTQISWKHGLSWERSQPYTHQLQEPRRVYISIMRLLSKSIHFCSLLQSAFAGANHKFPVVISPFHLCLQDCDCLINWQANFVVNSLSYWVNCDLNLVIRLDKF